MERFMMYVFIAATVLIAGCEKEPEMSYCYPQRVKRTIPEGAKTSQVTADFKYENDKLDYIIWSNFQTHYFDYHEDGTLRSVARKNVQTYRTTESVMVYDEGKVVRTDEYRISLDRFTQENEDTTYTGYRSFRYEGEDIVLEEVYKKEEKTGQTVLTEYTEYSYDPAGNITRSVSFTGSGRDTIAAFSFTYDDQKNPYNGLAMPFEGESHVNNVLERIDLLSGDLYFNQILYTDAGYPEQLNVKQESYLTEVIQIDYLCD